MRTFAESSRPADRSVRRDPAPSPPAGFGNRAELRRMGFTASVRSQSSQPGGRVLFDAASLAAAAAEEQADTLSGTFGYKGSINSGGAAPPAGDFGITRPFYRFEPPGPHGTQADGVFTITGTILADIQYQVNGGNHTDISSENDNDLTRKNYQQAAADLTPSPTAIKTKTRDLFKNQPPRDQFWAEDLTIRHERFHARENVRFGQDGLNDATAWLNSQTASTFDEVAVLLNGVTPRIATRVDKEMALPGRENRAYDDGAPEYLARANAIRAKGDAKEYPRRRRR